ncbi:MAG: hypothetical protein E7660_00895 [Ruminococcaceae bacterium]|nr:hypothetical protein [Oscillospiraceae bacterium]
MKKNKSVQSPFGHDGVKSGFLRVLPGFLIPALGAVGALLIYILLMSATPLSPAWTGLVILGLYLVGVSVAAIVMKPRIDLEIKQSDLHPLLGEIMLSSMSEVCCPVLLTGKSDRRIIWYNKEASEVLKSEKSLKGADISKILEFNRSPDETEEFCSATFAGRQFVVKQSIIRVGVEAYVLHSLIDVTELEEAKDTLRRRETVVAYVMVDNLEEMLSQEQEEYRLASSSTETILRTFATEAGGVLKEYQKEKYIFLFNRESFDRFVEQKFDILDKIREVRVGSGSIPITVSMGVANIEGTLAEKEKAAQSALELALQRGGDQAVVKHPDGSQSIFGGRTKTLQKKAKVRARIVANEILVKISEASNVIIMAHKRPDFDAFGASIGMARFAMFCGVPVNVVTDFSFGGIEKCLDWIKDEKDYKGILVSREAALDLVTPDTLLIIVDVNNPRVYEEPHLAESCRDIIIIDHHRKTEDFAKEPLITYIEPSASATCELVCEMLEQVLPSELLLPREADIMFAGILLDTNQFRKNTGTRTFSAALYLRDHGVDISAVQEFFKTTLDEYERENKFRSSVEIYRDVAAISVGDTVGDAEDSIPAARAADKLLELEGIKASFVIVKMPDAIHISARSVGTINVQLILEKLKGGGHFDSAGAQIKDKGVKEVVELLKEAIDKYLDESK